MITNIVDHRSRPYRWARVNAIVEPTWHDNSVADTDHADPTDDEDVDYDSQDGISLSAAIVWAQALSARVTLYIYDDGQGTTPVTNWTPKEGS